MKLYCTGAPCLYCDCFCVIVCGNLASGLVPPARYWHPAPLVADSILVPRPSPCTSGIHTRKLEPGRHRNKAIAGVHG